MWPSLVGQIFRCRFTIQEPHKPPRYVSIVYSPLRRVYDANVKRFVRIYQATLFRGCGLGTRLSSSIFQSHIPVPHSGGESSPVFRDACRRMCSVANPITLPIIEKLLRGHSNWRRSIIYEVTLIIHYSGVLFKNFNNYGVPYDTVPQLEVYQKLLRGHSSCLLKANAIAI